MAGVTAASALGDRPGTLGGGRPRQLWLYNTQICDYGTEIMGESELSTYQGSCHCGAVKYEVTMVPPAQAYACNCSICSRAGWLLAFVGGDAFRLLCGEEMLSDYQFHHKRIHHFFCRQCGIRSFSRGTDKDGKPSIAINLRCLQGLEATKLPVHDFDGASL